MSEQDLFVLDCTIRDGGLVNGHHFEHRLVRALYEAVSAAGVDCVELGYRNARHLLPEGDFGPWKFCDDADLKRAVDGVDSEALVSVMVDVGRVDPADLAPAAESPIDMVRVASYVAGIDDAIALTAGFDARGYETTINIMAVSRDDGPELDDALRRIAGSCPSGTIYIVDSFGALDPFETGALVDRFRAALPGTAIGFHGHNNQQLALANTLEAIRRGATRVDGTVYGMGRAAGNCPLELLLGRYPDRAGDIGPLLDLIAREFIPLREEVEWGYIIPYALTGLLNRHPREAMELRSGDGANAFRAFYERLTGEGSEG